ncbi:MAG: DUF4373 domain-containing protein [Clostridia bacterium]|nr:DUF4373 domain-containing protein [Clostridia bacterium]
MGRLKKQTAEYFPHFVGDSRTKFVLENTWGNDGYAFWFKLLELLCRSDGHYYDCSRPADKVYLTAIAKVEEETADAMLELLASMEKIDSELWNERKIIWCQHLVDNLAGMYAKRTTAIPSRPKFGDEAEQQPEALAVDPKPEKEEEVKQPKPAKKTSGRKKAGLKTPKPEKKQYAEFVKLTEAEYETLVALHGGDKVRRMIEVLDNYKGANGKKYTSDYRAILNWVVERVNEEYAKRGGYDNGFAANRRPDAGGFTPSSGFRGGEQS